MKKIASIIIFIFGCEFIYPQVPNWSWAHSAAGTSYDEGYSISTDAAGNVYVTGEFESPSITFGTITLTNAGNYDLFIVKYDASGNVLWAKSEGGTGSDRANGISTDADGNAYITGHIGNNLIVKYDASGNVLWAKSAGGAGTEGRGISIDAYGNAYIAGEFGSPSSTFGTTTLTNHGFDDIFIAKYDASGNVLWAKSAGGTGDEDAYGFSTDDDGNAYITGHFGSPSITFGTTTLTSAGGDDLFIAKYDASGNVLWAKAAGGTNYDVGYGISADTAGNVYVTGIFQSPTITFGTTILTNAGGYNNDIFIVKYDATGNMLWAKRAGGPGIDAGYDISTDATSNVYVTGYFQSPSITFGTTTLTNAAGGEIDIFIVKYDASGNVLWATAAGGTGGDEGIGISTDDAGNVYVTGGFWSTSITFGTTTLINAGSNTGEVFVAKLASSSVSCTPAVTIAITSGANPTYTGQSVTFTATPTNGGTTPTYQWQVNGINVGTNSATFTTATLTNGDMVKVIMTSNADCASPTTVSSNTITMTVTTTATSCVPPCPTCAGAVTAVTWDGITYFNPGNGYSGFTGYPWTAYKSTPAEICTGSVITGTPGRVYKWNSLTCAWDFYGIQDCPDNDVYYADGTPNTNACCTTTCAASPANLNLQVHPNPANQNTLITFYLCASVRISLDVFNILGQQITILADRKLNSGNQSFSLNTNRLAAGVYFVRLQTINYKTAKKLVILH